MRARKQAHLTVDGANRLQIAAIGAHAIIQNIIAHIRLELFLVERNNIFQALRVLSAQLADQLCLYQAQSRRAGSLIRAVY